MDTVTSATTQRLLTELEAARLMSWWLAIRPTSPTLRATGAWPPG